MFDLIVVAHNELNWKLISNRMKYLLHLHEEGGIPYELVVHDNRTSNIGFAAAVNLSVARSGSPYIGLLNPDTLVAGPFLRKVKDTLDSNVQVTGCRWAKSKHELRLWAVKQWVCGAAFFTTRQWWELLGGFDDQFVWSWEETDFIKRTEDLCGICQPIDLPLFHEQRPGLDTPDEAEYKHRWLMEGARRYFAKHLHRAARVSPAIEAQRHP